MGSPRTVSKKLARTRADRGAQMVNLAKDDLAEAISAFSTIKGFARHTENLVRLQDQILNLRRRIEEARKKELDLTEEAKSAERKKIRRSAAQAVTVQRKQAQRARRRQGVARG